MKWAATDLPRVKSDVMQWVADTMPLIYHKWIEEGKQEMRPDLPPREAALAMTREELRRLHRSELFHVSASVTELVKVAAQSLPEFTLLPHDLPSPCGFVYYETPVYTISTEDGDAPVSAMAWGVWESCPWPEGGVWVTIYTDGEAVMEVSIKAGRIPDPLVTEYRRNMPPLLLDNELQVRFTEEPVEYGESAGRITILAQMIRTTWLLMAQPLTSDEPAKLSRQQRRQAEREGQDVPPVRVIDLRRHARNDAGTAADDIASREYHHRWIVRGHWRQHWYPKTKQHRPVWIAPHIKGPDDAPLIGGERVYAVR